MTSFLLVYCDKLVLRVTWWSHPKFFKLPTICLCCDSKAFKWPWHLKLIVTGSNNAVPKSTMSNPDIVSMERPTNTLQHCCFLPHI